MAVDALNFDGCANLAVELGVAVGVLDEVAVDAMHSFFEVDIKLVHGQTVAFGLGTRERCSLGGRGVAGSVSFLELGGEGDGRHERRGRITCNGLAAVVEQLAMPVFLVNRPEDPAMAVKIGKLRVPRLGVELGKPRQESGVGPVAARGGLIGVRHVREREFLGGWVFLRLGIHQFAVGFLVPPHVTGVRIEHIRARMYVADDALAGGDCDGELVLDRVAGLVAGNGRVGLKREPLVAVGGVRAGVDARAVVGVDHVAGRAAARAKVAGVVIRSQEVERRVEQAGFLKADEHGIGTVLGSQSPRAQSGARPARIFERVGNADLLRVAAAALEDSQDVARLRGFKARQGVQEWHDALVLHLEARGGRHGLKPLRRSAHAVAFAVPRAA